MEKKKGILKKVILRIIGIIVLFILITIGNLMIFEKTSSAVSKGQPIDNFNEKNYALLVIDIQEATTGVVSENSFYTRNSDDLIKNINQITESFLHQNIPVIYIRSEITNPLINLLNNSYAKGSLGAKFDKRLNIGFGIEVVKSWNDAFLNSNLDNILSINKINELYIVGLDAAQCINITVEAAQNRNYRINLIEEAILSESAKMKDSMILSYMNRGVKVLKIDSLKFIIKNTNAHTRNQVEV